MLSLLCKMMKKDVVKVKVSPMEFGRCRVILVYDKSKIARMSTVTMIDWVKKLF